MADAKETCRAIIAAALNEFIKEKNPEAEAVAAENIEKDKGMPNIKFNN